MVLRLSPLTFLWRPGKPAGVNKAQIQIGTGTLIVGIGAAAIITAVAITVSNQNNNNNSGAANTFASADHLGHHAVRLQKNNSEKEVKNPPSADGGFFVARRAAALNWAVFNCFVSKEAAATGCFPLRARPEKSLNKNGLRLMTAKGLPPI